MLTAANTKATLQKAGHASIVELDDGSVYMVHLCGRPIGDPPRCILGRETAIQKCHWSADGWLRLDGGGTTPFDEVSAPNLPEHRFPKEPERIEFNDGEMPLCFQTLRVPIEDSWATLTERPGWLRLYGRESTFSRHNQSLLARRVDTLHCEAATCLDFQPETYQQMAGLVAIYDVSTHYYLFVSHEEERGRCVRMIAADKGKYSEPAGEEVSIPDEGLVYFRVAFSGETLQFYYSTDGKKWDAIGPSLNATLLSDEYCNGFTGAFVGICAQDMSGRRKHADFDWFEYRARSEK
jgi:xylan 1,4-beta-xylosidase